MPFVDPRTQNAAEAMANLQARGLVASDTIPKNRGLMEFINDVNRDIMVKVVDISKQPKQVFPYNPNDAASHNPTSSKELAKKDHVFITAETTWYQKGGVSLDQKPNTFAANRWLAAQMIQQGSHHLSSNEEIDAMNALGRENFAEIRRREADYGRDILENGRPDHGRNRSI